MRIYQFGPDVTHFRSLFVELRPAVDQREFDGKHRFRDRWRTPTAVIMEDREEDEEVSENEPETELLPLGDIINPGNVIVAISARAADGLADLLEKCCELLPFLYEDKRFWLLNVLDVRDCLDRSRTEARFFDEARTRVMDIHRYGFHEEKLASATFFKIPELKFTIFVTGVVADRIAQLGLTGGRLIEVGSGRRLPKYWEWWLE